MKGSRYQLTKVSRANRKGPGQLRQPSPTPRTRSLAPPAQAAGCLQLSRILVPIDFSRASIKPLCYASALADTYGGKIVLLHVTKLISYCVDCGYGPVNRQEADPGQVKKDRLRLKRFAANHLSPGTDVELIVRSGKASDQILGAANETPADLIVLYAHEMNPADLVGSHETADRVMRSAPCPVLVVRPHEHEFIPPTGKRRWTSS